MSRYYKIQLQCAYCRRVPLPRHMAGEETRGRTKMTQLVTLMLVIISLSAKAQFISTVAGNGMSSISGDGETATDASIGFPGGIAFDKYGNYYFAAGNTVRKVSSGGYISTIAGSLLSGYSGDNSAATAAELNGPSFIAVDKYGNVYVSDYYNCRIRKFSSSTGIITTFAGNGSPAYNGDDIAATSASLQYPQGISFDNTGNLFIADNGNHRVRKVDTLGKIYTIAGSGVAGDAGDGSQATSAQLKNLWGLKVDINDNLYLTSENKVRKISASNGIITTVVGNGSFGYSGDGDAATNTGFSEIIDVAIDKYGYLYVSDDIDNRVLKVDPSNVVTTFAGNGIRGFSTDGGAADTTEINSPRGIDLDSCGNLFVADNGNNRIRKITYAHCDYLETEKLTTNDKLLIFPNPTYDLLNINNVTSQTSYRVYSIVGAVVEQGILKAGANILSVRIFPNGLYLLALTDGEGKRSVTKIVKE